MISIFICLNIYGQNSYDGKIIAMSNSPQSNSYPEYIPMLASENQWNELVVNVSLAPEYQYQKTYLTKIGSDTIIDGISYYQLLTAKDELSSDWQNNGYIREDIAARKVYYKDFIDAEEILLYSFNLSDMQVGNEIASYDLTHRMKVLLSVESVEYIYIGGKERMIVSLRSNSLDSEDGHYSGNHVWIEGIGNLDGFLRSALVFASSGKDQISLLCFFQNNELLYKPENSTIDDCFVYYIPYPEIISIGKDTTFCVSEDRIYIGEDISITGGTPPYTYTWSGKMVVGDSGEWISASDFLSDVTALNPYFTQRGIMREWFSLQLTVEDRNQIKTTEKMEFRFSEPYASIMMEEPIIIQLGDSALFDLSNDDLGGILPYANFTWEPQEGLLNPDAPITWCKPEKETRYYCYITDSVGCSLVSQVYWVIPSPMSTSDIQKELDIYQSGQAIYFNNPSKEEADILFYTLDGSLIHQHKTRADYYLPNLDENGRAYLCVVNIQGKRYTLKYLY